MGPLPVRSQTKITLFFLSLFLFSCNDSIRPFTDGGVDTGHETDAHTDSGWDIGFDTGFDTG